MLLHVSGYNMISLVHYACILHLQAELKNLIDDQPELGENIQGRVAWEGDALHKVLGEEKPGQVHGMGLLPDPKLFYGRTSHHLKQVNITTIDGSSSEVDTHVLEKVGKLEEHVKKQDKLIQDLVKKLACRENIEPAEVKIIIYHSY